MLAYCFTLALYDGGVGLHSVKSYNSDEYFIQDMFAHDHEQLEKWSYGLDREYPRFCPDFEKNQIIAGCNGSVIFGSIYTDQLWVHPDHRGRGLGHKLMAQVHDYGCENECAMATVATMSFQGAKAFYEKLGYVVDFERPGYTQNSSCIFLKRSL